MVFVRVPRVSVRVVRVRDRHRVLDSIPYRVVQGFTLTLY